jgi:hypothetical protein
VLGSLGIMSIADFEINESPIDAQNLKFNVRTVDWKILVRNTWISGRRYLLKESDHNIDKAIHRRQL